MARMDVRFFMVPTAVLFQMSFKCPSSMDGRSHSSSLGAQLVAFWAFFQLSLSLVSII